MKTKAVISNISIKENCTLNGFGRFGEVTKAQREFGSILGTDFEGVPENVAAAAIRDIFNKKFYGKKIKAASEKQVEFGKLCGWDFSGMSRNIAFTIIQNILWELNFLIIKQQNLEPGAWTINIYNEEKRQISSIDKNGLIKFTDMRRPYRYARSLLRYEAPAGDDKISIKNPLAEYTSEQLLAQLIDCVLYKTGTGK